MTNPGDKDNPPRPLGRLNEHLLWQLEFLDASVERFDAGHETEAMRIATCLRILCHDTRNGTSLLTQLGLREATQFVDTSTPRSGVPSMPWRLLVHRLPFGHRPRLYAPAQAHGNDPDLRVSFLDWWNGVAFIYGADRFTRWDVIRYVANQDGGAHVDPNLGRAYLDLKTAGTALAGSHLTRLVRHPFWELLRQMAYEMQLTMVEASLPIEPPPVRERVGNKTTPAVITHTIYATTGDGQQVGPADDWYVTPGS